jgi:hypothetical protein
MGFLGTLAGLRLHWPARDSNDDRPAFAEDAERTADLYMQGGKVGGDAYDQMRKAIPSDLAKPTPYEGHSSPTLTTFLARVPDLRPGYVPCIEDWGRCGW